MKTEHDTTPPPQRVRVVGKLDSISHGDRAFTLVLDDGVEACGVLTNGDADGLASLFGRRVLVRGAAVYGPSDELVRIDAEDVALADGESPIWSRIPESRTKKFDVEKLRVPQGPGTGVSAIIGKWPGDETDEEVRAFLDDIS